VANFGIGYGVVPIRVSVFSILALGACGGPTGSAHSCASAFGFDVRSAGFLGTTWGTVCGIGSSRTPESLGCERANALVVPTYLCQAEAYEAGDCSTQDGREAAAVCGS
jgi:hypothetical protein